MIQLAIFIYMLLLFSTVYVSKLFIMNLEEGGLFYWWERNVLFPLRLKNSKFAKPLGDCELCFTTWLGSILGSLYWIIFFIAIREYWWLLCIPSIMYLSIGITTFFMMVTNNKK